MKRETRILGDAFIKSLSIVLEAGNTDDIKKLAGDTFSSSDDNKKKAFFDAEQSVLSSCIANEHFDKVITLFETISSNDNIPLKVCNCIALANSLIEKKNVLVDDKIHSQELGKLLTQECEKLAASDREKISKRVEDALKAIQYNQEQCTGKIREASVELTGSSMHKNKDL